RAIEPGKYPVILEPAAGFVLLENLYGNLDQRSADEGRSFLSKAGGGTRKGEKMVDERVTIYSDPQHPKLPTQSWSGDGRPYVRRTWIDKGAIATLSNSRYWAQKQGIESIPGAGSVIMEG